MGNRTASKQKAANIEVVKLDTSADSYYRYTMALIKLRKNKRLVNVPNGVFRCILEYQLPKL